MACSRHRICFVSFNLHHSMVFITCVFHLIWLFDCRQFRVRLNLKHTIFLIFYKFLQLADCAALHYVVPQFTTFYYDAQDFELSDLHNSCILRATEQRRSFVGAACRISMAKNRLEQLKSRNKLVSPASSSARSSTIQLQTTCTTISVERQEI